jgi:hypothetical protein
MRRHKVIVTTAADGTATAFSPRLFGKIHSIRYVKDGTNGYADGVDFAITSEDTGENIWTESNVNATVDCYPRAPVKTQAGVAALYAAGGTAILDKVAVVGRIKIVLAQGGNAKVGTFFFMVD